MTIDIVLNTVNPKEIGDKIKDPKLWTYIATEWHRLYREFVPFKEGILYSTVDIVGEIGKAQITHTVPYAHYMYDGMVMGPNIPISQGGAIVGYFSPVKPKHYTGSMLHYRGKACARWDQAAIPTKMPLLMQSVGEYIRKVL